MPLIYFCRYHQTVLKDYVYVLFFINPFTDNLRSYLISFFFIAGRSFLNCSFSYLYFCKWSEIKFLILRYLRSINGVVSKNIICQSCTGCASSSDPINPFNASVMFHTETRHLKCNESMEGSLRRKCFQEK